MSGWLRQLHTSRIGPTSHHALVASHFLAAFRGLVSAFIFSVAMWDLQGLLQPSKQQVPRPRSPQAENKGSVRSHRPHLVWGFTAKSTAQPTFTTKSTAKSISITSIAR